jgi:hypothetical protein
MEVDVSSLSGPGDVHLQIMCPDPSVFPVTLTRFFLGEVGGDLEVVLDGDSARSRSSPPHPSDSPHDGDSEDDGASEEASDGEDNAGLDGDLPSDPTVAPPQSPRAPPQDDPLPTLRRGTRRPGRRRRVPSSLPGRRSPGVPQRSSPPWTSLGGHALLHRFPSTLLWLSMVRTFACFLGTWSLPPASLPWASRRPRPPRLTRRPRGVWGWRSALPRPRAPRAWCAIPSLRILRGPTWRSLPRSSPTPPWLAPRPAAAALLARCHHRPARARVLPSRGGLGGSRALYP